MIGRATAPSSRHRASPCRTEPGNRALDNPAVAIGVAFDDPDARPQQALYRHGSRPSFEQRAQIGVRHSERVIRDVVVQDELWREHSGQEVSSRVSVITQPAVKFAELRLRQLRITTGRPCSTRNGTDSATR